MFQTHEGQRDTTIKGTLPDPRLDFVLVGEIRQKGDYWADGQTGTAKAETHTGVDGCPGAMKANA